MINAQDAAILTVRAQKREEEAEAEYRHGFKNEVLPFMLDKVGGRMLAAVSQGRTQIDYALDSMEKGKYPEIVMSEVASALRSLGYVVICLGHTLTIDWSQHIKCVIYE